MLQALPLLIRTAITTAALKALTNTYKNRRLGDVSGTSWTIHTPKTPELKQTVSFKTNDEVSGFGGCNQFFGKYTQDGDKLTFGALATTRKTGPMIQHETYFLEALKSSRRFKGTPSEIKIYGESDDILLILSQNKR